jgi:hypothetical protein
MVMIVKATQRRTTMKTLGRGKSLILLSQFSCMKSSENGGILSLITIVKLKQQK